MTEDRSKLELVFHGEGAEMPVIFETHDHPFGTNPPHLLTFRGKFFLRHWKSTSQAHYSIVTPVSVKHPEDELDQTQNQASER